MHGQLGRRMGQFEGYVQFFFWLEFINPLLSRLTDTLPTVQEEATGKIAIGVLLEFGEYLVGVRDARAAIDR